MTDSRPLKDLQTTGLLWLINKTVFHPRGFALALDVKDGVVTGWKLLGDGHEPWTFADDIDEAELARLADRVLAPRCKVCGLPLPRLSTSSPYMDELYPGELTMCLLDHGPPTLLQRWRAWRKR